MTNGAFFKGLSLKGPAGINELVKSRKFPKIVIPVLFSVLA
jgi:hypothetical protein